MSLFLELPTAPAVAGVAPVNTVAPVITGSTVVGSLLTINPGTWTGVPKPAGITFEWQSSPDGSTGWANQQSSTTYPLTVPDATTFLRCNVTFRNGSGSQSALSQVVGPITEPVGPPVAPTVPPTPTTV